MANDMNGKWHIYALEWDEEQLRWYVDGKQVQLYGRIIVSTPCETPVTIYTLSGTPLFTGLVNGTRSIPAPLRPLPRRREKDRRKVTPPSRTRFDENRGRNVVR